LKYSQWMKALALGIALLGAAPGCDSTDNSNVVRATSRELRGRVPVRTGALRVLRVVAINARTRRVVAQIEPNADGTFVLTGITVGAPYKVNAVVGRRTIPVVFPKARGAAAKVNVFEVGTKSSLVQSLNGPIDLGALSDADPLSFETPPENAPNLQEDFDEDGVVDGADPDVDGDGIPNAMDMDNDRDGVPDAAEIGDLDGDGLTNDADPDVDGDGIPNATDPDNDNDGIPDAMDTTPDGDTGNPPDDLDGDGLPNSMDETPRGEDLPVDSDAGVPDDASAPPGDAGEGPRDAGPAPGDAGEAPVDASEGPLDA
jgi:outer membrane lipoprotein SlyB